MNFEKTFTEAQIDESDYAELIVVQLLNTMKVSGSLTPNDSEPSTFLFDPEKGGPEEIVLVTVFPNNTLTVEFSGFESAKVLKSVKVKPQWDVKKDAKQIEGIIKKFIK